MGKVEVKFVVDIVGHDEATIMQMYKDWLGSPPNINIKPEPAMPKIDNKEFKEAFIDILLSNYRLGCAEYNRNPAYNDTHYHYKAEEKMMFYLQDNYPELWKEISKKVLEIDTQLNKGE